MAFSEPILALSLISGLFASLLIIFTIFFEKDKKRSARLLIWGVLLLGASFGLVEYAIWLEGNYIFTMILSFNFPLISYFAIWFGFLAWLFESIGQRRIWITMFLALVILSIAAVLCPNCITFRA